MWPYVVICDTLWMVIERRGALWMDEKYLTVDEVAVRLRVHAQTVRRWLRSGQLKGTSINRRAGWRISEREVQRFLENGPLAPAAATSPHS
jgi:excisionase family DNA binding protein